MMQSGISTMSIQESPSAGSGIFKFPQKIHVLSP